ncbi:MAG: diguanylate cyclase/phosphodiesterase with sensor(s) [Acidimicrobiaceae bacterium]|jgi:diguanylate cyclase (GGDEF)-like protein|nr:diguanylate cyclase/phosphodiesterase with sensor(s) [Acidimicrobiaceae bacterium]
MNDKSGDSTHDVGGRLSVPASGGRPSAQPRLWSMLTALLVLAGTVGSIFGANAVAHASAQKSERAFLASSANIASTLRLAIQHEQDLIGSTESLVIGNPNPSQAQFTRWADDIEVLQRYPEVTGLGIVHYVPAAQLGAYAQSATTTQSTPFQVIPATKEPFYCFAPITVGRAAAIIPIDTNVCPGPLEQAVLASRDSGNNSALPYTEFGVTTLSLEIPFYRGGSVPATVAARQKAFSGLIGLSVVPDVLLQTALQGHPSTGLALRFGGPASTVVFRSGATPRDTKTARINLHDGWTVLVSGTVAGGGVFGDVGALALLLGGVALSILFGALIYVLGTGRARSMVLVEEQTDQLRFQALHDSLTQLPNRALIMDRIEQLLARNRRNGTAGAALYVDLDDFKNVNDSLGHAAGDQLLVAVATRMGSTLRGADTIGRMGGDEFVVLIDGGEHMVAPELVAERILDVMRQPFELEEASMPLVVNTSIGIAVGDRSTGGELLRDADVALYQAKARGKNRYEFFHPEMQTEIGRRIGLEFDLRSALSGEQFRLVYQPIYNLEDLTVVGVEALLRWEHPAEGIIQPDDFIAILEQSGQIREVGAWVLREACAQMAAWHARGDTLDISVNVSGRQLDDDRIVEHVRDALETSGLDATSLIVEVTETALMRDTTSAVRRLQAIKDLGVRIAVDDFGTGYSSLSYLQQFPIDCIKIDKSFTNAIATSPESKALVRTLVQLGKDLGLKTLAEGVETADEMDLLRSDHVNEVQGFLFARPLDPETLEAQFLAPMRPVAPISRREGA